MRIEKTTYAQKKNARRECHQRVLHNPSPIQSDEQTTPLLLLLALVLEVCEDLGEVVRIRVDLQHLGAHHVDDGKTAVPERLLGGLHQERLERVGDFIAHVRVRQVEAGQEHGLELVLRGHLGGDNVAAEHVDENHVGRGDEALVLPALEQQRAVHAAQPKHRVGGREVLEPVASPAQELPQTPEQLAGGGLNDHPLGSSRYSVGVRQRCLLNRGSCVVGVFGALVGWT